MREIKQFFIWSLLLWVLMFFGYLDRNVILFSAAVAMQTVTCLIPLTYILFAHKIKDVD